MNEKYKIITNQSMNSSNVEFYYVTVVKLTPRDHPLVYVPYWIMIFSLSLLYRKIKICVCVYVSIFSLCALIVYINYSFFFIHIFFSLTNTIFFFVNLIRPSTKNIMVHRITNLSPSKSSPNWETIILCRQHWQKEF